MGQHMSALSLAGGHDYRRSGFEPDSRRMCPGSVLGVGHREQCQEGVFGAAGGASPLPSGAAVARMGRELLLATAALAYSVNLERAASCAFCGSRGRCFEEVVVARRAATGAACDALQQVRRGGCAPVGGL